MMDSIQLTLDVHSNLKNLFWNSKDFIKKQHKLSEASYPLLVSYLAWLRKINSIRYKADVMEQNEQELCEFKFLSRNNLLFFLTVTGQFSLIAKLFQTPTFSAKLRHLINLIRKEYYKAQEKRIKKRACLTKNKNENQPTSTWQPHLFSTLSQTNRYRQKMQYDRNNGCASGAAGLNPLW